MFNKCSSVFVPSNNFAVKVGSLSHHLSTNQSFCQLFSSVFHPSSQPSSPKSGGSLSKSSKSSSSQESTPVLGGSGLPVV
ncbi:MAG: hypothetical protein K6E76_06755 [Patescibacteria group bacterium]|nr:hypothetical protein [Patescibacteria group bacterium]